MPGYDEETVRNARENAEGVMGDSGVGGTGRTGDVGAGGAISDAAGDGPMGAQDQLGEEGMSGVRGSGTFDPNDDVGRGTGATGAGGGMDSGGGSGTYDVDDDLGGIGGTGMANAEQGSSGQNRLTPAIGAAGDQTDEDLLETR